MLDESGKRLILLHHCRGIGWKGIYQILQRDCQLMSIFKYDIQDWKTILPRTPLPKLSLFFNDLHSINIDKQMTQYKLNNIKICSYFDKEYPNRLKHIYNPPWVLYMKGNFQLMHERKILSVVGTRNPTNYGESAIKRILPRLVENEYVIVSGLAAGIDTYAHQAAMKGKGKTIAVLGGGLFQIYPKENVPLALQMMKEQLVISETPPFQKPEPWMFPLRNRIISGISDGALVIEAKEKSGSLITAYQALEQGKEVFALPGNITSPSSVGTNQLIQEGAKLVLTFQDIDRELAHNFLK